MIVLKEMDPFKLKEYVHAIQRCGDHPLPGLTDSDVLDKVVEILDCYIESAETYEDTSSKIIFLLDDGRVGVFEEWSDSSGHG